MPLRKRQMTDEELQQLYIPPHPHKEFHPLSATNKELVKYGYPARPNEKTHPLQFAKWQKLLSRHLSPIKTTFSIIERSRTVVQDFLRPANFAGAIIENPPDQLLNSITATWTVPNIFPSQSLAGIVSDGEYEVSMWVGIDGLHQDNLVCGLE